MDNPLPNIAFHRWGLPALVALAAGAVVLCGIDAAGDYPQLPQGPGLTVDESFNVQEGVRLVVALPELVAGRFSLQNVFGSAAEQSRRSPIGPHNPDHPPGGRIFIGLVHQVTRAYFPPNDHDSLFVTSCARPASGLAFAGLVFLVGWVATKWYGRDAGFVAAVAVVIMPRLFGHAHLASLETCIGTIYAATVLAVAHNWSGQLPPSKKAAWLTGCLFGLALLTKIQAILLPVPVAIWAICYWRRRALLPLMIWIVTAGLVFFVGWPWLWLDPLEHLLEYFGRTTNRETLSVFYLGQEYADVSVPWHYPAVMFLITVPVGLQGLGFIGLFSGKRPAVNLPREQLVLGCVLFPLILFSLPGIAVYDGARLFLVVFPLWAILIARGSADVLQWLRGKLSARTATSLFALFFAAQGYGVVDFWPCHLSYYNLLVGGLRGAERLGLEPTYWGDSLTRDFLEATAQAIPPDATLEVFPMLHPFFVEELLNQSPILRHRRLRLKAWIGNEVTQTRYIAIFRRRADLPPMLQHPPPSVKLLALVKRQGVLLAALYEFSPSSTSAPGPE